MNATTPLGHTSVGALQAFNSTGMAAHAGILTSVQLVSTIANMIALILKEAISVCVPQDISNMETDALT